MSILGAARGPRRVAMATAGRLLAAFATLAAVAAAAPIAAGPREWAAASDRSLDQSLIETIDQADPAEGAEILSGLALRADPSVSAYIEHFLHSGSPPADAKSEYLLRVLLGSFFPPDAPASLLARRVDENRRALSEAVARLGSFPDLALRTALLRLAPRLGDPAPELAAEAADLVATLRRQDGLGTPAQDAYALALLELAADDGHPDLLAPVLLLGQLSRNRAVVVRSREVGRLLASPAGAPADLAAPAP